MVNSGLKGLEMYVHFQMYIIICLELVIPVNTKHAIIS